MAELTPDAVEVIVLHCSATTPEMDVGVKEIDRWHRKRGFFQIGYHDVIRRDGTHEIGRPLPKPGAHAEGFNDVSIGICLVGGINESGEPEDNFTPEQFVTLKKLVEQRAQEFNVPEVMGHTSIPGAAKACPVFDTREFLNDYSIILQRG